MKVMHIIIFLAVAPGLLFLVFKVARSKTTQATLDRLKTGSGSANTAIAVIAVVLFFSLLWPIPLGLYVIVTDKLFGTSHYYGSQDHPVDRSKAEQGSAVEQFALARNYDAGWYGLKQDHTEALKWYRKAANQGYAIAQTTLGTIYKLGLNGINKDYTEADKWLRKAANQGDEGAQDELGDLYEKGLGTSKDYSEAYFWYSLSASGRQPTSNAYWGAKRAEKYLTPEQIAAVKKRVAEWKPTTAAAF